MTTILYLFFYSLNIFQTHGEWIVSAGLIAGIVLVFLLLGYLFYALFRAEAF
nr:K(+)-transporting ATPase subunit F [Pantoea multigeneris]